MRGRGGNVREREHEWDKIPENVREETVFRAQGKVQHSTGWRAFLWCLWERMNQWVFNADICKFNIKKLMQDFWKALILCVKQEAWRKKVSSSFCDEERELTRETKKLLGSLQDWKIISVIKEQSHQSGRLCGGSAGHLWEEEWGQLHWGQDFARHMVGRRVVGQGVKNVEGKRGLSNESWSVSKTTERKGNWKRDEKKCSSPKRAAGEGEKQVQKGSESTEELTTIEQVSEFVISGMKQVQVTSGFWVWSWNQMAKAEVGGQVNAVRFPRI